MATRNDLSEALPQLIDAEQQLHDYANSIGIDYRIADYGAVRTEADTNLILKYRQDDYNAAVRADPSVAHIPINVWRPIASYGSSYHNYGAAFDVLITVSGQYGSSALDVLKNAASQFGLSSSVPNDRPHFELAGISVDDARQLWIDYTTGTDYVPPTSPSGTGDVAALVTIAALGALLLLLRYFKR